MKNKEYNKMGVLNEKRCKDISELPSTLLICILVFFINFEQRL